MQIVIVCLREGGMIRGGIRHPHAAVAYESTSFSTDQLREMVDEPELVVTAGHLLAGEEIDAAAVHEATSASSKPGAKARKGR